MNMAMKPFKAPGIPYWITVFAAINVVVGCVLGFGALFEPTQALDYVDGADALGRTWGGRNAGFAMALAIFLKHPAAYTVAFAGAAFRDVGDLVNVLVERPFELAPLIFVTLLLGIILSAFIASFTQARSASA